MFEDLLNVLLKNPHLRRQEDITIIKKYIRNIAFLREQFHDEEQSYEQLAKSVRLKTFQEGEFVYKIGAKSDTFYLILQGMVELTQEDRTVLLRDSQKQRKNVEKEDSNKSKILVVGEDFGEIPLSSMHSRMINAMAISECHLAIFGRKELRLVAKQAQIRLTKSDLQFFKGAYLFESWTDEMLREINQKSQQIDIPQGKIIYKEGDTPNCIYIIKKGIFEMNKKTEVSTDIKFGEFPKLPQSFSSKIGQMCERDVFGEEEYLGVAQKMQLEELDRNEEEAEDQNKAKQFQLKSKLSFDKPVEASKRSYSVHCVSLGGGVVIQIQAAEFIGRVLSWKPTREIALITINLKIERHSESQAKNFDTLRQYKHFLKQENQIQKEQIMQKHVNLGKNSELSKEMKEILIIEQNDKGWRRKQRKELQTRISTNGDTYVDTTNQTSKMNTLNNSSLGGVSQPSQSPVKPENLEVSFVFSKTDQQDWEKDKLRVSLYKFDKARLEEIAQKKSMNSRIRMRSCNSKVEQQQSPMRKQCLDMNSQEKLRTRLLEKKVEQIGYRMLMGQRKQEIIKTSIDSDSQENSTDNKDANIADTINGRGAFTRYINQDDYMRSGKCSPNKLFQQSTEYSTQDQQQQTNFSPLRKPQFKRPFVLPVQKLQFQSFYPTEVANISQVNRRGSFASSRRSSRESTPNNTNYRADFYSSNDQRDQQSRKVTPSPQNNFYRDENDQQQRIERIEGEERSISAQWQNGPLRMAEVYKTSPDSVNRLFHYLEKQRRFVQTRALFQKTNNKQGIRKQS